MTITKVRSKDAVSKQCLDKTDWNKVYNQPQASVDQKSSQDSENPVLKDAKFKRINDK
jgi:hypothetical protein